MVLTEKTIMGGIAVFMGIVLVANWIRKLSILPDPWDADLSPVEAENVDSPVCEKCLTPVSRPDQHYCPVCGNVTGEFTRYMPFENIRFNYSIFATLWRKIKSPDGSVIAKAVAVIMILLFAPLMLVVGVPVLLFCKVRMMVKKRFAGAAGTKHHDETGRGRR